MNPKAEPLLRAKTTAPKEKKRFMAMMANVIWHGLLDCRSNFEQVENNEKERCAQTSKQIYIVSRPVIDIVHVFIGMQQTRTR